MEDSKIIELYWQRSEDAIQHTADKYGGYCKAISVNILQNQQDADECVSDTYLHAWNAIPPNRPSAFRVWLGRITRNLSLDRLKRAAAQKRGGGEMELLLSELEGCVPAPGGVERTMEDQEIAQLISVFLRQQKQLSRLIFLRRYYYADSVQQIALRFGLSQSNVKSTLFRTRNALKLFLESQGVSL